MGLQISCTGGRDYLKFACEMALKPMQSTSFVPSWCQAYSLSMMASVLYCPNGNIDLSALHPYAFSQIPLLAPGFWHVDTGTK